MDIQIEHAPAIGHVWIAEQLVQETLQGLVGWVVASFTLQATNNACRHQFPIFDEGPQPLGLEYQADSIVRRPRIAAGEQSQKALRAGIHPQGIPMSIEGEYGIGLQLRHEKLHGTARGFQFWRLETSVRI